VTLIGLALVAAAVCALDRPASLLALVAVLVAVAPMRRVRAGATGRELIPVLGATGRVQLVYGALLTLGLALG
jgi:1,4-dihydroxy-2-naphthoate octaprenyltransferase